MVRYHPHAAVLATAAFFLFTPPALAQADRAPRDTPLSRNLHRAKVLLEGDVRTVWLGDSWTRWSRIERLPYGALAVWPIHEVTAVELGFKGGGGIGRIENYTSGMGALLEINAGNFWEVEPGDNGYAHFALPVGDMTRVFGDPALVLPVNGPNAGRIQSLGTNNAQWFPTDAGAFSLEGDALRARLLYYAPANPDDLLESVVLTDWDGTHRATLSLREASRPKWHLGQDPDQDEPVAPTPSQINAAPADVELAEALGVGARIVVQQDPDSPLVGSGDYWVMAGLVLYHTDGEGRRTPGYYHTVLAQDSWSFAGHADDRESSGEKVFSDEQLRHWLDVTTLDRDQQPVVILHIATEGRTYETLEASVRTILERYRAQFAAIGTPAPKFLLVGSYMHRVNSRTLEGSRLAILTLDSLYADLAQSEPDCAFFSLYQATDGVFFTTDTHGGEGAQQAARDWLDNNGWSTISYGGVTYNLSSADDGGIDAVFTDDGLHLTAAPAAAFYAKLLGDAIAASACQADFDGDGLADTRDMIAYLQAWAAGDQSADITGDGIVNTRDVIAFLDAWAAGC